jgi:hypothetical protein
VADITRHQQRIWRCFGQCLVQNGMQAVGGIDAQQPGRRIRKQMQIGNVEN